MDCARKDGHHGWQNFLADKQVQRHSGPRSCKGERRYYYYQAGCVPSHGVGVWSGRNILQGFGLEINRKRINLSNRCSYTGSAIIASSCVGYLHLGQRIAGF